VKRILRVGRRLAGPAVRVRDRHPMRCGALLGAVLAAVVPGFAPAYVFLSSAAWMLVIFGGLTLIVAIVARVRSRVEDEW
jgi:hypothetical protein